MEVKSTHDEKHPGTPNRKKVGLALSSGAARGLAHIGVIEILEKEGVPIDMIAGTSAGAIAGALYAQQKDAAHIRELMMNLAPRQLIFMADLNLPKKSGLIRGHRVKDQLKSAIGDATFDDLEIPFACVATDIDTGEEVVLRHGSVVEAVRASISIPGIFAVVKRENRYLVDGGIVTPVPVRVLKEMGADFIIAVNVIPNRVRNVSQPSTPPSAAQREPNIFSVIMHVIHIASNQVLKSSLEGADIVIEPQVSHIGFGDFHRFEECARQGELAARSAMPKITKILLASNL